MNIIDVEIKPKEVKNVFVFKRGVKIVTEKDSFWIPRGKPYSQLLRKFAGMKMREVIELRRQKRFQELDSKVLSALRSRDSPIVLRIHKGEVFAVVSERFVHIDHDIVFNAVEATLKELGIDIAKTWERIMQYDAEKIYWLSHSELQGLRAGIRVTNSIRATWAINIYASYLILTCNNVLYNPKALYSRVIHIGEFNKVLLKIPHAVRNALEHLDEIAPLIKRAKELELERLQIRRIIDALSVKYPQHIKKRLIYRSIEEESTLWGVSQTFSWTASHYPRLTDNYRYELAKDAFKILRIPDEKQELLVLPAR